MCTSKVPSDVILGNLFSRKLAEVKAVLLPEIGCVRSAQIN